MRKKSCRKSPDGLGRNVRFFCIYHFVFHKGSYQRAKLPAYLSASCIQGLSGEEMQHFLIFSAKPKDSHRTGFYAFDSLPL